ncbi:MAG: lipid-A-disaccharide synthase N-terminal domain-containing protein [Patescibacteria group bacterium]
MLFGFDINFWLILGLVGQFAFFMRFIVQWIASERAGNSVVPITFWYFSIVGGLIILIYALHIKDPVFILGQGLALTIYIRNLVLIRRNHKKNTLDKPGVV